MTDDYRTFLLDVYTVEDLVNILALTPEHIVDKFSDELDDKREGLQSDEDFGNEAEED